MPKATSGGASNAWEQPDGEVFEMNATWEPAAPVAEEQPDVDDGAAAVPVGEQGPEVVDLPDGTDVVPATRTAKARKA